jgi:hypothetical protein
MVPSMHLHNRSEKYQQPLPTKQGKLINFLIRKVVFCSEKCREAIRHFHEIECPIVDMLFDEEIGTAGYLALRVLFSKTPSEWLEFDKTPLGRNGWDDGECHGTIDRVYRSDDYKNVFTLVKNASKRRPPDTWHLATIAVFLMRVRICLEQKM